jgi:hypothetical protein
MRSNPEREDEDIELTGPIIWNYFKVAGVQSKSGGAKNVTCNFCDTVFVGCSSSRAFAHILGKPVLGKKKSNAKACVPMSKSDYNRYAEFKTEQKVLNQEMTSKEERLSFSKAKQSVLNLTSIGKRTVTREMKNFESKELDSTIASFILRMPCHLMLLIRRVLPLWLISAFNSVIKIPDANTKYQLDAESAVRSLIQHMKILLLKFSRLWTERRSMAALSLVTSIKFVIGRLCTSLHPSEVNVSAVFLKSVDSTDHMRLMRSRALGWMRAVAS